MVTKAQMEAQRRYDKKNTRSVLFKFNLANDADILAKLDDVENRQGYVKNLIREDIRGNRSVLSVDAMRYLVKPVAIKNHLRAVYLFGSYARGEAGQDSDIDIMVDGSIQSVSDYFSLSQQLEELFGKKVDLVVADTAFSDSSRAGKRFLSHFERDKVVLYEAVQ